MRLQHFGHSLQVNANADWVWWTLQAQLAPRRLEYVAGSHWLAHEAADNITDDDSCRMGVKRWRRAAIMDHPGELQSASCIPATSQ